MATTLDFQQMPRVTRPSMLALSAAHADTDSIIGAVRTYDSPHTLTATDHAALSARRPA